MINFPGLTLIIISFLSDIASDGASRVGRMGRTAWGARFIRPISVA